MQRMSPMREGICFDDVLLVPAETSVKPADVSVKTRLTNRIELAIPVVSAGHETVTESAMAIALARLGGLGVIHDNMPLGKQVEEVRRVKRAEAEMITNPITISPDSALAEALDLMQTYHVSGLPVVDGSQKVVGILTKRDIRFSEDYARPVKEVMTADNLVTVNGRVSQDEAKRILQERKVEKLIVLDEQGRCAGLMTVRDIETLAHYAEATRDDQKRLRVGAAVGLGKDAVDRAMAMADAGLDVVFVDVAHAHTRDVVGTVSQIRQQRTSEVQIVAGNVATADAARALVDNGADAIKVGVGGTRCSAQRHVGVGMPQMAALIEVAEECERMGVPMIVDGGVSCPASLAKALGAGASVAMFACALAGTDEAPGEVVYADGGLQKFVASANVMRKPTTGLDPYSMERNFDGQLVSYKGGVAHTVKGLVSGVKSAMAYAGAADIETLHRNAQFVKTK